MTTENLTEPLRVDNPLDGDKIKRTYDRGLVVIDTYYTPYVETQQDIEDSAREWRNQELHKTDYIVPLTDHTSHSSYITYRQSLRDWTDTEEFPETRPTLL
tara:strand:+ start:721 stop:1023 length:303 start_codon:yes stop_codon:yes gene_type:complete